MTSPTGNGLAIRGQAEPGQCCGSRKVVIVGGGGAGLAAAWTLKKHGIDAILLEANPRVGGRLGGDRVDGFSLDEGADFFCGSYDVALRLCEELGLPLIRSFMNLGWYRNGRWMVSRPPRSIGSFAQDLPTAWRLGLLSPAFFRLMWHLGTRPKCHSFSSDSRLAEIDGEENFGDYLNRIGAPESLQVTVAGFLEMTMGDIETACAPYMRTYLAEMMLKANQIYVPEKGAGALTHALADACGDMIRVSSPVQRVIVEGGSVTGVAMDDGLIEADAVICATPATAVFGLIPDLPEEVRRVLQTVKYSCGCRVVMGLDRPPLPPGWHGALYPEDETPLLLDRSINLPACAPPGKSTLDLLVGRERAKELFPLEDDEIKHQLLRDARRNPPPGSSLPGDHEGLFTRVYRWKEAVCMAPPGMFRSMAEVPGLLHQKIGNLFLAGDYMRVPSVNGALASGIAAAEEIANRFASRSP